MLKLTAFILCLLVINCAKKEESVEESGLKQQAVPEKTNAAQSYIDAQKSNIDRAKAAVEKSRQATEAQEEALQEVK